MAGTHYLYAVRASVDIPSYSDLIKIGHTMNIKTRIRDLRIGCPVPIRAERVWRFNGREIAIAMESLCHRTFSDRHAHGEWHRVGLAEIDALIQGACDVRRVLFSVGDEGGLPDKPRWPTPAEIAARWRPAA